MAANYAIVGDCFDDLRGDVPGKLHEKRPTLVAAMLCAALCLAGCASPQATAVATATLSAKGSALDTARKMDALAQKCWARAPSFSSRGLLVDSVMTNTGSPVITVTLLPGKGRVAPGAFFFAVFKDVGSGSAIVVEERPSHGGLAGQLYRLDLTDHVRRWLSGETECIPVPDLDSFL